MNNYREIPFLCPVCGSSLICTDIEGGRGQQDGVDGYLACCNNHVFPVINGIPRLVDTCLVSNINDGSVGKFESQSAKSIKSFDFHYSLPSGNFDYDVGRVERNLKDIFKIKIEDVAGKVVAIVGCGNGSEIKAFSELIPKTIVAIDLTNSIENVRKNVQSVDNVVVVQADANNAVLESGFADIVYCDGVLPHTKDPRRVIANLLTVVKDDGVVFFRTMLTQGFLWSLLYIYPRIFLRFFLSKLSSEMLWKMCYLFGAVNGIPFLGVVGRKLFIYYDPSDSSIEVTQLANFRRYGKHSFRHRQKRQDIVNYVKGLGQNYSVQCHNNVFEVRKFEG